MTTIAFDGHTLAGDSMCSRGCMKNTVPSKVWRLATPKGEVLFGGSGDYQDVLLVKTWIEGGMKDSDKPSITADAFTGILVMDGTCIRLESKLIPQVITEPFHAVGAGRDFAIAAMHYGRSAREAVELACIYDLYTGGPVTELSVVEPESATIHQIPLSCVTDSAEHARVDRQKIA